MKRKWNKMPDTQVTPPTVNVDTPSGPAPLISTSAATQSTAAASSASAGAIVVILIWALSLVHISVPSDVSVALSVLVSAGVHWIMIKFGMPTS